MSQTLEVIAAVDRGDQGTLRSLLAESPALASARDAAGVSATMHAAYRGRAELLELLLAAGPELDIFEATATGRGERVAQLLQQDASLATSFSPDGFTALHFAAFFRQSAIADLLLAGGADPAAIARNPMKVMPLHSACAARNLPVARALLDHGAPPNARQQMGWTPLHAAAHNGDRAMTELLLEHGADPSLANDEGATALQEAAKAGHAGIVELLEKRAGRAGRPSSTTR